jgi:DNA-binding transcriptional MerR regulator
MANEDDISARLPALSEGDDEKDGQRMLIGELAQRCGLTTQSIRFYEREGLIAPQRAGKFRVYAPADIRKVETVVALRKMGVPIVRVREIMDVMSRPACPERDRQLTELLAFHLDELKRREDEIRQEIAATADALGKLEKSDT